MNEERTGGRSRKTPTSNGPVSGDQISADGTIAYKGADGTIAYKAENVVRKDGKRHKLSQTFDREARDVS